MPTKVTVFYDFEVFWGCGLGGSCAFWKLQFYVVREPEGADGECW